MREREPAHHSSGRTLVARHLPERLSGLLILVTSLLAGCAMQPWYDYPPARPEAVSPVVAANVVINANTRFVWKPVADVEYYEFHVFNRLDGDIGRYYRRELLPASVCDGNECSINLSLALPYMKGHAWRVRAGNSAGWSQWTRHEFTMVGNGILPAPKRSGNQ